MGKTLPQISRRLDPKYEDKIRAYATETGLAGWAWADFCGDLFILFWFLIIRTDWQQTAERAHGVWHTIQSDKTQRQMVKTLADAELRTRPKLHKRVKWILDQADELSIWRNMAAHVPASFSDAYASAPVADPQSTRTYMRHRFDRVDHAKFWNLLTGDLIALGEYTFYVASALHPKGADAPLPRRPEMRSPREIHRIEASIRQLDTTRRKPRRRASKVKQKRAKGAS